MSDKHSFGIGLNDTNAFDMGRRTLLRMVGAAGAIAGVGYLPRVMAEPVKGGVLRVAAFPGPSSLDPITGGVGYDQVYLYPMFDTLIEWDYETLKLKPGLAKSWDQPDPKTLVLDLQEGVTFHDGTPFDAQAVKFNLDRARTDARSNVKPDVGSIAEVTVTGPLQVKISLSQPDSVLLASLSDRAGMMFSPKALQELGTESDRRPVGAGPWKFSQYFDKEKLIVVRNDAYGRKDRPYLDGIELSVIQDVNTGVRSAIAGQNDFVYRLAPRNKLVVDRAPNLDTVMGASVVFAQILFNYSRPPFDNAKVREAVNLALNRDAFNKVILGDLGKVAHGALPPEHWAADPTLKPYPHDPQAARRLLAEAGHKDGLEVHFVGYSDQEAQQRQELITEQLRAAGIRARFSTGTTTEVAGAFLGSEKRGDAFVTGWTGRTDPSLTYQGLFGKDSYYNAGRVEAVPGLQEALQQTRELQSTEDRIRAFAKVQQMVREASLFAPLAFVSEINAVSKRVKNYVPNLLSKPKFNDVYLQG